MILDLRRLSKGDHSQLDIDQIIDDDESWRQFTSTIAGVTFNATSSTNAEVRRGIRFKLLPSVLEELRARARQ